MAETKLDELSKATPPYEPSRTHGNVRSRGAVLTSAAYVRYRRRADRPSAAILAELTLRFQKLSDLTRKDMMVTNGSAASVAAFGLPCPFIWCGRWTLVRRALRRPDGASGAR